jgi:16S rRNA (cytosine967-C5)-methyltransferase
MVNNYISNIDTNNLDTVSNIYSMPEWIGENLIDNSIEPAQLACSLNLSAPVCVRVCNNTSISVIENLLNNRSIPFHKSELVPNCLILDKRAKIDDSDEYKSGLFEIQDEGSQFISFAVSPAGNCTILDACAGAGGKTLHLSDICPEAKEITAADNNFVRLREFTKRLTRYNKKNVTTKFVKSMDYNDIRQLFGNKLFDYVLVDAPCTGIGTARRDPLKKFRTTSKIAEKMQSKQLEILKTYSKFVKPGGILVYATCSFLTTENIDVVNKFLESEPEFEPDNLYNIFTNQGINPIGIAPDSYYLGLYPHIHGTDGFFMARMKRVN